MMLVASKASHLDEKLLTRNIISEFLEHYSYNQHWNEARKKNPRSEKLRSFSRGNKNKSALHHNHLFTFVSNLNSNTLEFVKIEIGNRQILKFDSLFSVLER
jgi:hypothetical protein